MASVIKKKYYAIVDQYKYIKASCIKQKLISSALTTGILKEWNRSLKDSALTNCLRIPLSSAKE